ncbi:MAG: flagellin [bacterium]
MGIVVNTNISSLMVQRSLSQATSGVSSSLEKLSTGFRINKAADDAAGLTISESLKAQARGSQVAQANAQTGINLLQTAEGDLSVVMDNLQRMRDLSVQAANGTNGTSERAAIKAEVAQRASEISRIANSSAFNQVKLLNGTSTTMSLQIGANYTPGAVSLNSISIGSPLGNSTATSLGINSGSKINGKTFLEDAFSSSAKVGSFIAKVDSAISAVTSRRSTIGSLQNRLDSTIKSLSIRYENMSASESRIRDVDVAKEAASLTKSQILQQAASSLLSQANQAPKMALSLLGG